MSYNQKIHIDDYASALLSDKRYREQEYRSYVESCYIINNVEGNIAPDILNAFIHQAKKVRKIRKMLSGILCYVDKNSISQENFCLLMSFPARYRNTYLSNVAHADLAFYQMQALNHIPGAFEAFAWLFDHICHYDFFKEEDMLQILRENPDITSVGIEACINLAFEKYGASDKLSIATAWVGRMKSSGKL